MLDKKSVVVLYSGGFYDSSARAIIEELQSAYSDVYVIDIDKEAISPWKIATFKRNWYITSERNATFFNKFNSEWNKFFAPLKISKTRKEYKEYKKPESGFKKWVYDIKASYKRVYNVLSRFEPDVVLCTTPELLRSANKARHDLGQFYCSIAALITDYALDKRFVHYKTDIYFVQNESIKRELVEYGIDSESIEVIGTPLEKSVTIDFDRDEVLAELGISNNGLLNLLFVGGRYGSAKVKNALPKFVDGADDYNLIIVIGGSSSLSNYAEHVAKTKENVKNIYFIDAIDNMAKLYAIADVVIATPTTTITYEAISKNKPLILLKGTTVTDKANAHYLSNNGVALLGNTTEEAVQSFLQLIDNENGRNDMLEKQREMYRSDSAAVIAAQLVEICKIHYANKQEVERKRMQIMSDENKILSHSTKSPVGEIQNHGNTDGDTVDGDVLVDYAVEIDSELSVAVSADTTTVETDEENKEI